MDSNLGLIGFVGILVTAMAVVVVGKSLSGRQTPTLEEYRRAQIALAKYEDQQQSFDEQTARLNRHLDRQESILSRIERLVDRWEKHSQSPAATPAANQNGIQEI